MNAPVTVLPSVMQAKKAAMMSLDTPPVSDTGGSATPPVQVTQVPTGDSSGQAQIPPVPTPQTGGVTLTQDQYNELQASAGRLARANDQLAEMATRLTELEAAAKGAPKPQEPAPPVIQGLRVEESGAEFTEEEKKDFGDSEGFIAKVVRKQLAEHINPLLDRVNAALASIQSEAKAATTTAGSVRQDSFKTALLEKVPTLQTLITHKHWQDFLVSQEPITGDRYADLLSKAIQLARVDQAANIYKTFAMQYKVGVVAVDDGGFAGASPSGGATTPPPDPTVPAKLKGSDRKQASDDYRKGRIDWARMQEISSEFAKADAKGNVDWTK